MEFDERYHTEADFSDVDVHRWHCPHCLDHGLVRVTDRGNLERQGLLTGNLVAMAVALNEIHPAISSLPDISDLPHSLELGLGTTTCGRRIQEPRTRTGHWPVHLVTRSGSRLAGPSEGISARFA